MYREDQSGASFVLGMMTGAFIGAGVALLFAPQTGTEMRQRLGEGYRGLADRVGERTQHLREQGRERVQHLTSRLSDRSSSTDERSTMTEQHSPTADRFPSSAPTV